MKAKREVNMSEVNGITCVKGYGLTIAFVGGVASKALCPISGTTCCAQCDVIIADEANEINQVKNKGER